MYVVPADFGVRYLQYHADMPTFSKVVVVFVLFLSGMGRVACTCTFVRQVSHGSWTKGDNYYYGADELFKYQPNIADNILREAPFLAESLLEAWVSLLAFFFFLIDNPPISTIFCGIRGEIMGNLGNSLVFKGIPSANPRKG